MPRSSIRFVRNWYAVDRPDGSRVYQPMLRVLVRGMEDTIAHAFLVDSGADLSMAPYSLCRELGLRWQDGTPIPVQGISRRKGCVVAGRIHEIDIIIPEPGLILRIPIVFAKGNAPYVLGRNGIFDVFTITFDAARRRIAFELTDT